MNMAYSADFRQKVLQSLTRGLSVRRAAKLFGIHFTTIQKWKTAPDRPKVPQIRRPRKISKEALLADVETHPTDYLHERAKRFNCTPTAVHKAMRRYRISQKKRHWNIRRPARSNAIAFGVSRSASASATGLWCSSTNVAYAKTGSGDTAMPP